MIATIYYYEFCENNSGYWSLEWYEIEADADAARTLKLAELGDDANTGEEELCGEYGDVGPVQAAEIELSVPGILHFARSFDGGYVP